MRMERLSLVVMCSRQPFFMVCFNDFLIISCSNLLCKCTYVCSPYVLYMYVYSPLSSIHPCSFCITCDLNPALPQVMQCDMSPPPPTTSLSSYQLTVDGCICTMLSLCGHCTQNNTYTMPGCRGCTACSPFSFVLSSMPDEKM